MPQFTPAPSTQSPTAWARAKLLISAGADLVGFSAAFAYAAGSIGDFLKTFNAAYVAHVAQLLGNTGASIVGFIHSLANAVTLDLRTRGRLSVWSADFGHDPANAAAANDTALINALTAVFNAGGGTVNIGPGTFSHVTVPYNWTAGTTVRIVGAGERATRLAKSGATASPILDLTVNVGVLDVFSSVEHLELIGNAKNGPGLQATRLANFITRNVSIVACSTALESLGCLNSQHYKAWWGGNNIGFRCRKSGVIYPNLVKFVGGNMKGNSSLGLDIGDCSHVVAIAIDVEANGAAADLTTGGTVIRATCDDETGLSEHTFFGCWYEANLGETFKVEACGGLHLSMRDVKLANVEANRSANIGAIKSVIIENMEAGSAGDTVTIAATCSYVVGGTIGTLADTSTHRTHIGVTTGAGVIKHRMTSLEIDTGGIINVPAGGKITAGSAYTDNALMLAFQDGAIAGNSPSFYMTNGAAGNAAAASFKLGASGTTSRSINVGGTVNASGADYAEYETLGKGCGKIAAGDICGFDAEGFLTVSFAKAVSFGIKSTNPSFIGGDTWGVGLAGPALEKARRRVDRIAYSGKVPVNIWGAVPGQWIVPAKTAAGGISGKCVDTWSSEVVGRVRCVLPDGRALVVVAMP